MMAAAIRPSGLPSGRRRARRSALPLIGGALLGTVVVLWFGLATYAARRIAFPEFYSHSGSGGSPERIANPELADPRTWCGADFQNITLTRQDGHRLAMWWVPGSKPAGIILLHGAGGNRHEMLPFLKFIHAAGYPAIVLDEIDHGDSDHAGWGAGYGWPQRDDVLSAAAALRERGYREVGALGVSQGAAAAILAQAQAHSLDAIVSDSCYANLGALLRRLPSMARLNPLFLDTILWESGFWIGRSPDRIAPAAAAADLGNCGLLVIQGGADPLVPAADGEAIYRAARGNKQIWIVPAAGHIGALGVAPVEYARAVIAFFDRNLSTPRNGATAR